MEVASCSPAGVPAKLALVNTLPVTSNAEPVLLSGRKIQCKTLCKYHRKITLFKKNVQSAYEGKSETERKQKCKCSLYHSAPVPGPLNLRAHDITADSFQVNWDHSASDIVLYRLSWAPFSGGDTKEVSFNKIRSVKTVFCRCKKKKRDRVYTNDWSASKDELPAWTLDF